MNTSQYNIYICNIAVSELEIGNMNMSQYNTYNFNIVSKLEIDRQVCRHAYLVAMLTTYLYFSIYQSLFFLTEENIKIEIDRYSYIAAILAPPPLTNPNLLFVLLLVLLLLLLLSANAIRARLFLTQILKSQCSCKSQWFCAPRPSRLLNVYTAFVCVYIYY